MVVYYNVDEWDMWTVGKQFQMVWMTVFTFLFLAPAAALLWWQRKTYVFTARPLYIEYLKLSTSCFYMFGIQLVSAMLQKSIRSVPPFVYILSVLTAATYSCLICLYIFSTGYRCFFQIQLQSEKTKHNINAQDSDSSSSSGAAHMTARSRSWYLRRRNRFTTRFFVLIGYAHAFVLTCLYVLLMFVFPAKPDSVFYPILIVFLAVHTCILVYLFRKKSRSQRDGLEVTRELKYVASIWWVSALVWLAGTLIPVDANGNPSLATNILTALILPFGHCASFWFGLGFTLVRVVRNSRSSAASLQLRLLQNQGEVDFEATLEYVLTDEGAPIRQSFLVFLESEWAPETLLFLSAVKEIRQNALLDAAEYRVAVRKIYTSFLVDGSPLMLNLPAQLRQNTVRRVLLVLSGEQASAADESREDLFDTLFDYVFRCLSMDGLLRFIEREKREGQMTSRANLEQALAAYTPPKPAWPGDQAQP